MLNTNARESYACVQDLDSKQVLHELVFQPEGFKAHFERYPSSTTYLLLLGKRIVQPDAKEKQELDRFLRSFVEANALSDSLLDIFPFFNHLPEPLAPWKAKGKQINQEINRIINKSLEERRGWNWAEHIMHRQEASKLSPDALQCLLFELYLASSITTYIILQLLIKACIQHPEAMREMQIELDTVVDE